MWKQTLSNLVKGVSNFSKANPPVAKAVHELDVATRENSVLDDKTHELIALNAGAAYVYSTHVVDAYDEM